MENNENTQWKPRWTNELRLSREKHDYFMLTDASYEDKDGFDNGETNPYWVGQFHSVKLPSGKFKTYRSGEEDGTLALRLAEDDPRVGEAKNKFFFNAVHFDIYHKDPVRDARGNVRTFTGGPNKGNPIMSWQPVEGIRDRKQLAKDPDEDTAFFRKTYLSVGSAHYTNLLTVLDKAKELCLCGGHLDVVNYQCSSCGESLLDMSTSNLSVADLNRFGDAKHRCNNCSNRDYPVPVVECDSCDEPTPHRFDQVVVKGKKTGTGPQTVIQIDDVISVAAFTLDNKEPIIEIDDDGNPIIENGEFFFREDLETIIHTPWDFDGGNPPPSNGEVSSFLGLRPGDAGYSTEVAQYGKPKREISRRRFR